jgi:hypothetical protein
MLTNLLIKIVISQSRILSQKIFGYKSLSINGKNITFIFPVLEADLFSLSCDLHLQNKPQIEEIELIHYPSLNYSGISVGL